MGIVGNLNSEQLQFFNSQGYLVIESFSSSDEVDSMRKRMAQLLEDFDCSSTASIQQYYSMNKFKSFYHFSNYLCFYMFNYKQAMITSMKALRKFLSSLKRRGILRGAPWAHEAILRPTRDVGPKPHVRSFWLTALLKDLGFVPSLPALMFCDNKAAIHIAATPVFHERTKHIDIDCHVVREKVQDALIKTLHVSTNNQLVDVLTN